MHINSFQKDNGVDKIRLTDSEKVENSEYRFFTQKCIFLSKLDIFKLIVCTTLWYVNSQLLIYFEDLQMEKVIQI